MRFGIPPDLEVEVVNPVHNHETFDQVAEQMTPKEDAKYISPIEMLTSALQGLEALRILKWEESTKSRRSRLENMYSQSKGVADAEMALFDAKLKQKLALQDQEVNRIIAHQEQLKKEEQAKKEEAQRRLQEEEKQRKLALECKQKEEEERKKQAEEDARKKAEEQKKLDDIARAERKEKIRLAKELAAKKSKGFTNILEVELQFAKYKKDIADIKINVVEELNKDKELKKHVNALKRKVNVKFGQLNNSVSHVQTICQEVVAQVNLTKNSPLAFKWLLNFISKAIVAQAEAEVTVKPTAALPLAMLANYLLQHLEGLDYFLCARFVKKCSFIIGYSCAIDTEEGRVRMGWKRSQEKWEDEVKYEERVGGICTVWAVMARLDSGDKFPFFSMDSEWRFLARMLNTEESLLTNTHYVVLSNWWEGAAQYVAQKYGKQAFKVLTLATDQWAAIGKSKRFPAATRFELLGEDMRLKNLFNLLKEMER